MAQQVEMADVEYLAVHAGKQILLPSSEEKIPVQCDLLCPTLFINPADNGGLHSGAAAGQQQSCGELQNSAHSVVAVFTPLHTRSR